MDFTNLKNFMDSLTDWIIPGNSAVVYKNNKKVFEYSSGYSNLEEKIKMTGKEMLNIYSCSKVMTVTAAMQLLERGEFLLSDPLYKYIPEFEHMKVKQEDGRVVDAKNHITIGQLFTMSAGFSYDAETPAFEKARKLTGGKMDTITVIKCLAEDPLLFEPGTRWNYSLCHDVLAGVVEAISGKKFRDCVKENILDPLEMKDTYYHVPLHLTERVAQQYRYDVSETDLVKLQQGVNKEAGEVINVGKGVHHIFGDEYDSGGAGITTTVGDYAKFAAALANGGVGLNGKRIISRAAIDLMRTNQLSAEQLENFNWPQLAGYGYGLGVRTMVDKVKGGALSPIGEFGWGGAAGATILVDPDEKLAIFYAHHMHNPQEDYYQPRLRNVLYSCLD